MSSHEVQTGGVKGLQTQGTAHSSMPMSQMPGIFLFGLFHFCDIYHKPSSRLSICRNRELNLVHLNNLKAIVPRSCTENTELPDRFMSAFFSLLQIVNLS